MDTYNKIKIIDTAFGGYGVGKINGNFTIFVPFTVEGDIIDAKIIKKKKSYCIGEVIKIHEKSQFRRENYCEYNENCGGCTFGFIKYENQLKIKEKIVYNFFRKFKDFKINDIIFSEPYRYRLRAKFRIYKNNFGFLKFKSSQFIPINDCLICKKSIIEKINYIAKNLKDSNMIECYIIENENNEALLNIKEKFQNNFKLVDNIVGVKFKDKTIGENFIKINHFYAGFNTFSQSNTFLLTKFMKIATNAIEQNDNVLELYSGSGFFTSEISKNCKAITAVEENKEAINLLKKLNLKNLKIIQNRVEKLKIKDNFSLLFVDPPRAGLEKNVIKLIKEKNFEKIIYVSCNPSTLSRDLELIKDNYKIEKFYLIDMFPNTHHIETIATLKNIKY